MKTLFIFFFFMSVAVITYSQPCPPQSVHSGCTIDIYYKVFDIVFG
jgi:hypothetical protein